jgi:hypothetical protein
MLLHVLISIIIILVLFLAFISLLIITHYVSVGYQSTTTTIIPCDIWYLSGDKFSRITKVEVTFATTMKHKELSNAPFLRDVLKEIDRSVFLEQKDLAVKIMPNFLRDYGRVASGGTMEHITHEIMRKIMSKTVTKNEVAKNEVAKNEVAKNEVAKNEVAKFRGKITRVRLFSDDKITTINRRKPTNFAL